MYGDGDFDSKDCYWMVEPNKIQNHWVEQVCGYVHDCVVATM